MRNTDLGEVTEKIFDFTKCGEGRGGVQAFPWKELTFRGWRAVGDKNVVVVIAGEWEGESGHPGGVADL